MGQVMFPTIVQYQSRGPRVDRKEGGKRVKQACGLKKSVKVSIVTVVYNGSKFIEATIRSVLEQRSADYEYIIIDGNSTDDTLSIIRKYEDKIDYWLSESDLGISDAFNKGISLACGDWINLLNAGDFLCDGDALGKITGHLDRLPPGSPQLYFATALSDSGNRIPAQFPSNSDPLPKKALVCHQAAFVHRQVYERHGLYSLHIRYRMDYDFFLRVLSEEPFAATDTVYCRYIDGGLSHRHHLKMIQEGYRIDVAHLKWHELISRFLYTAFFDIPLYVPYKYFKHQLRQLRSGSRKYI